MENKIYIDYITQGLKKYADSSPSRFHMPGHKGNFSHQILNDSLKFDVTELSVTDDLYAPIDIIEKSERQAAEFYGTKNTVFSPFGATSCIFTMLYIYKMINGKKLLVDRCSHKSVFNALGVLDIECDYIYPDLISDFSISDTVNLKNIKKSFNDNIGGILITSPNYYGVTSDIENISKFCKKNNILLMIDNSHGSHFFFNDKKRFHPLSYNVDFCVDSIHKTLPVATGGALLHCNLNIDKSVIKKAMGLFYSSSPSYLIMSSIDSGLCYMFNSGKKIFDEYKNILFDFKNKIKKAGYNIYENPFFDDYKILISLKDKDISGYKLLKLMNEKNIYPEMCDDENILLMLSPFNKKSDLNNLTGFLKSFSLNKKIRTEKKDNLYAERKRVLSLNQCIFSQKELLNLKNSKNKICSDMIYDYPPGIPIILPGEIIDDNVIEILNKKSYNEITVIK